MEFIKTAYCVLVPLLLLFSFVGSWKKMSINLLAVINLLLIINTFLLIQQMLFFYSLAKSWDSTESRYMYYRYMDVIVRLILLFLMPLCAVFGPVRRNRCFSFLLLVLLYSCYPFHTWNNFDIGFKLAGFFCLLCAAYALLWLWNKLPYQTPPR